MHWSFDIAVNAGLNKKTINNMYRRATKEIVIDASKEHFEVLYNTIKELARQNKDIDFTLTLKLKNSPVSVELNIAESLIVINTLAVKRAALRGGAWSTVGKQVEKVLMITLCRLFGVSDNNFNAEHFIKDKKLLVDREVDFYLINGKNKYRCEVKLTGQGNPESTDAIIARSSDVFIADTLSPQNKNQCDKLGISWVCLKDKDGYKRFAFVLDKLGILYTKYTGGDLEKDIDLILKEL